MPAKHSAGILLFRRSGGRVEMLLGHMGGPFWQRKSWARFGLDEAHGKLVAGQRIFLERLAERLRSSGG
jgi:predicted NUDIX family NTP pyrophosphohydrolase